jgi:hypothetical protein
VKAKKAKHFMSKKELESASKAGFHPGEGAKAKTSVPRLCHCEEFLQCLKASVLSKLKSALKYIVTFSK